MGVTLYVMLLGVYPFEERNNKEFMRTIKNVRSCSFCRPPPEEMDTSALNLIENMLVADRKKRFNLNDISQHDWVFEISDPMD